MGAGTEISQLFWKEVKTVAGFNTAAREKHWVPRSFWLTLSSIVSAVCIYNMINAWEIFIQHRTNVGIAVRCLVEKKPK